MIKKLLVAIIAFALIGGSVSAFAYWDDLSQTESETITLGQGVTLSVSATASAPEGKVLVPTGVVTKTNDVTSIVLTYDVELDTAVSTALNLDVSASDVQIGGLGDHAGLANINVSQAASTVNNTAVVVTVTVTLTEPTTQAEYDAIKNQPITFNLNFNASAA